ncbi:MAG: carbamoyltransferase [Bradymonadia bacterium]|jgi:carbamoyltransferase
MFELTEEEQLVSLAFSDGSGLTGKVLADAFAGLPIFGLNFTQRQTAELCLYFRSEDELAEHGPQAEQRARAIFPADVVIHVGVGDDNDAGAQISSSRVIMAFHVPSPGSPEGHAAKARAGMGMRSQTYKDLLLVGPPGNIAEFIDCMEGGDLKQLADLAGVGMQGDSNSRLLFSVAASEGVTDRIHLNESRCDGCGVCVDLCPTKCLSLDGGKLRIEQSECIDCQLCGEFCPTEALHPYDHGLPGAYGDRLIRLFEAHRHEKKELYRSAPIQVDKPKIVLGLATVTLMEHSAALLIDGELVAAVEEERLARERHYRFQVPGRPGASLASDGTIPFDGTWPKRAIDYVLRMAGITLDDVDLISMNGMPHRLRHSFSMTEFERYPQIMRTGKLLFVPHHLCHAASAYTMSDFEESWILTVDGHGDVETLGWYWAEGHDLKLLENVTFKPDRSFGGVFDTITQFLGFGTHGQGSTMALAALGEPTYDFSNAMSIADDGTLTLSENDAQARFQHLARRREDPLTQDHMNLAASLQNALEETLGGWIETRTGKQTLDVPLCVAGGVGLSCKNNGVIRRRFQPPDMVVAPAANDAGTAIGAAAIGHRELTGVFPRIDGSHSYLGPAWSDEAIARVLTKGRIPFRVLDDVAEETATMLANGEVLCWFQGRMEFGPRALGGRSIIADPRRSSHKRRVNQMKSRQGWRPFGPSILAGQQNEWFEDDWDSRFMLFAVNVKEEKRSKIPVVVHDDGSTRPQSVHAETNPRYHAMISRFFEKTGVPMVVNTSFNRGGEPIVMTPGQAVKSFAGLGADGLVIGNCLVTREELKARR